MAAFRNKDYAAARRIWVPLAAQGDANAEVDLGILYMLGARKDPQKAMALFQASAAQGDGLAEFQIGLMYAKGVPFNQAAGFPASAEFQLGTMYANAKSLGLQNEYTEEIRPFKIMIGEEANANENPNFVAGSLGGFGVRRNDKTAVSWYRKSADQGFAPAEFNLSLMIAKGKGGEKKDEAAAFTLCDKAADQDFGPAQAQLATMYERGKGVTADPEQALFWSTLAAKQQEKTAEKERAALAAKLPSDVVTRVQKSASEWKPVPATTK